MKILETVRESGSLLTGQTNDGYCSGFGKARARIIRHEDGVRQLAFRRMCPNCYPGGPRMSLLPEDASFEELVQDCFLAYRGTGLMLSPLDAALVTEWREKDVPFEVVARGIRKAAEKGQVDAPRGQPGIRSLRACRKSVELELRHHLDRAVGVGRTPPVAEAPLAFDVSHHEKISRALRKLAESRPDLAGVTEQMLSGILARPPAEPGEASRRGDVVTVTLLRAMALPERLSLLKASRARVGAVRMSARARRMSRRFHRTQVVVAHLGLPALG